MSLRKFALLPLCLSLMIAGCSNAPDASMAPRTVDSVDLQRYQGTWYEVARLPMFFQRNCAQSEAHYTLQTDGNIGVLNRCRTETGEWSEAKGTASPQVPGKTDKLWVVFDNWFSRMAPSLAKGDYWVLDVDDSYQHALVGSPSRKYLWLLSRTPQVSTAVRERMLAKARQQGYDTSRLIWRAADGDIGK